MATLEDKILGEKQHNYCSSSEDESDEENSASQNDTCCTKLEEPDPQPEINKWEGTSQNTGPKGVIEDWRRYKQLQNEKRVEQEKECIALAKKLTLSVKSALDEEKEKAALEDPELSELLDDEFLLEYQKQRMQEMLRLTESNNTKFGSLIYLKNGQDFLDAIDKEDKSIIIIIHIYEDHVVACHVMNKCLPELAKEYYNTKFCAISSSCAGLSRDFKSKGLPALLIYKEGSLISNLVRVTDDLGHDFYPEDVKDYLIEHGILQDKSYLPSIIKNTCTEDIDD